MVLVSILLIMAGLALVCAGLADGPLGNQASQEAGWTWDEGSVIEVL